MHLSKLKLGILAAVVMLGGALGLGVPVMAQDGIDGHVPNAGEYNPEQFTKEDIVIKKENGEELHFMVELALTSEQQRIGLMNRKHMGENEGMLFLFGNSRNRVFWMKDTLIPLDVIFLHANGEIHHIHNNAKPQSTTHITSRENSRAVLELPGGTAARMGIAVGDTVVYKVFRNTDLGKPE